MLHVVISHEGRGMLIGKGMTEPDLRDEAAVSCSKCRAPGKIELFRSPVPAINNSTCSFKVPVGPTLLTR